MIRMTVSAQNGAHLSISAIQCPADLVAHTCRRVNHYDVRFCVGLKHDAVSPEKRGRYDSDEHASLH